MQPSPRWAAISPRGVGLTLRERRLRPLLLVSAVTALVGSLWFAVDQFFVARSLHVSADHVGFLWAASGLGGLLGSAGLALRGERVALRRALLAGLGLRGLALLWYASMTRFGWALPAACVAGLGDGLIVVALGSLLLRRAPPSALGRVTAVFESAGQLGALAALGALAGLQGVLVPRQILLLCALALLGACAATWPRLWRPEDGPSQDATDP